MVVPQYQLQQVAAQQFQPGQTQATPPRPVSQSMSLPYPNYVPEHGRPAQNIQQQQPQGQQKPQRPLSQSISFPIQYPNSAGDAHNQQVATQGTFEQRPPRPVSQSFTLPGQPQGQQGPKRSTVQGIERESSSNRLVANSNNDAQNNLPPAAQEQPQAQGRGQAQGQGLALQLQGKGPVQQGQGGQGQPGAGRGAVRGRGGLTPRGRGQPPQQQGQTQQAPQGQPIQQEHKQHNPPTVSAQAPYSDQAGQTQGQGQVKGQLGQGQQGGQQGQGPRPLARPGVLGGQGIPQRAATVGSRGRGRGELAGRGRGDGTGPGRGGAANRGRGGGAGGAGNSRAPALASSAPAAVTSVPEPSSSPDVAEKQIAGHVSLYNETSFLITLADDHGKVLTLSPTVTFFFNACSSFQIRCKSQTKKESRFLLHSLSTRTENFPSCTPLLFPVCMMSTSTSEQKLRNTLPSPWTMVRCICIMNLIFFQHPWTHHDAKCLAQE